MSQRSSFTLVLLALCLALSHAASAAVGPVIGTPTFSPNPIPVAGGQITVSVKVTDSTAKLSSVTLYETYPNGGNYNGSTIKRTAPMTVGSDGVTYTASISVDANYNNSAIGEVLYITAVDAANNQSSANVATQGYSNTSPTITSVIYSPKPIPVAGGTVKVTAKVADPALGLSSVTLYETYPNGGNYNGSTIKRTAPMTVGSDGVTYTASVPVDMNTNNGASGENLYIIAVDPANNQTYYNVATQGYSNVPPSVTGVTFSPDPIPVAGATVKVTAKVADPALGVSSVTLYENNRPQYNNPGRTAPMTVGSDGVTYTATIPVDANPNNGASGEQLYLIAIDPAGNQTYYNVATQGYSNEPPTGSLPLLIATDASHPVLSPASILASNTQLVLTINGINFASGAVVLFNGVQLIPTSITSTQIKVSVPAAQVSQAGSFAVSVLNPSPGGASNSVNLVVR